MSYASVGPYTFNYSYLQTVDVIVPGSDVTCYLEFEITQAVGPGAWSDANIFMYEREPADEDGNFKSYFSNVCTPTDLEEIDDKVEPAANAPTPVRFRLNYVRAYFRSRLDLQQTLEDIISDIQQLSDGLALAARYLQEPKVGIITSG